MGSQRTYITFAADFPDDAEFDESGELSVPGGRTICERLVECTRAAGIPASDPEQYKFFGKPNAMQASPSCAPPIEPQPTGLARLH